MKYVHSFRGYDYDFLWGIIFMGNSSLTGLEANKSKRYKE